MTVKNFGINQVRRKDSLENKHSFMTFFDLFCFKEIIINKTKRKFFKLASKIISKKLSLEYQLRNHCNLEKLKLICLNQEQIELFNRLPNFRIEKHLSEVDNLKIY